MARPNFSGDWTLNRAACTLSPGADGVKGATWHIEHREPRFRHKASFETQGNPITFDYELLTDGPEVTAADGAATTTGTARWDGNALLVTWRTTHPGGEVRISFRHELMDEGRQLRSMEEVRGTGHDQDNVWVFERRA